MGITVGELKNHIDTVGGNILRELEDGSLAILAFDKYNNILESKNSYIIYLQENGEMFQINNGIGTISDLGYPADQVRASLLNHNSETKFGTWEVDAEDGQIKHTVEIPLEDNTLTEKQFKRIIGLSEQATVEFIKMMREMNSSNSGI